MGRLNECSFCIFQRYKRTAELQNMKLVMQRGDFGGTDIFIVPKDMKTPLKGVRKLVYFKVWLLEITDHCVCGGEP